MFKLFILMMLLISIFIILSKNIIQSILYLVFLFIQSSILFIYLGADFIGLIILIVYIGAIAVLFLFIIMMLNIRLLEIYSTFLIYLPLSIFLCFLFIILLGIIFLLDFNLFYFNNLLIYSNWNIFNNIKIIAIGELLFNECLIFFWGATLLLLVSMIGAILLTLEYNPIKKFNISMINIKNIYWKFK